jgi:hypothetical protein
MPSKNLAKNNLQLIRHNTSLVKKLYPNINRARIQALKELTKQFGFSFASGDVIQLENGWFVTHTGLVRLARRKRCRGIHVEAVDSLCDSAANRFVLKATVYPSKDSAGFVGYGDADPSNVSRLVRGGEMVVSADSVSGAHWVFFLPAGEPLISTPPLTSVNGLVSSEADSVNCRRRSTSMPSALPSR